MPLYHLLYHSCASEAFTSEELPRLLQQSSLINQSVGITGLLLYTPNGRFAQLLEGSRQQVLDIYQRIVHDRRNHSCEVLVEGPWSRRSFTSWYVGLADTNLAPKGLPMVCVDFQQLPTFLTQVAPTRPMLVHQLLSFVEPFLPAASY
ncbi:BLUF domain-containing protein [Hymenobacter swuensis]|uniref:BLUF domain-containing protein n=1 Tax=Hymenobacter swuensis DY53 TaxID=1227739 RepID=W8EUR3_9BACT|nr:BLUF domain-containing protein [Hymenobacter swuensis]AHJ95477.1 hypothetical protein Hsw_PA0144 [Hymenobacter swuensis DY53]